MLVTYTSENYIKYTHPNLLYQGSQIRFNQRLYGLLGQARPRSVLEIGCGEGFVLDYLAKRQPEVAYTGADLSRAAVTMGRQITARGIAYTCAHGGQMPFPDRSFDLVLLSEVLEHIPGPEQVLAEAIRLSRAYLLITVPLEPYFQALSDLLVWLNVGHNPGHINHWTAGGFRRWLAGHVHVAQYARSDLYQLALCQTRPQ